VLIAKDGTKRPIANSGAPIRDEEGNIIGIVMVFRDITERKQAEEALQESEEKYRALFESATDMIYMIDKNNKVLSANKAAVRLFGKGLKEIIGKSIFYLFPEKIATRFSKNLKKVFEIGKPGFYEANMIVGRRESWISVNLSPVRDPKGRIMAVMGVTRDITEQKKRERQIKASLKEKEVLLREIHHRVKNNMQIISSLLKLQSQYIKDKPYADIFKESQDRIKSMSLIHEMLYQSKHLSKINFKEYIRVLANYLFRSCWPSPCKIALKIESENVYLAIDNAIPCGLIIHELVSNSLKHAFSGSKEGEIKIALHSINERDIELVVSDDGVGMPEDLDIRNTKSLGLHLVTILAEDQLQGEIKLDRNKGTEFQIKLRNVR
jgi:PAS domain S-box-containing protein